MKGLEVFVGTSGWFYDWNEKRTLDWYIENSGLNAVELNASFYRFPFPNQIKGWAKKGKSLVWAVKVSRLITHRYRFNEEALRVWKDFKELFKVLDECIAFYLFQLPPDFTAVEKAVRFSEKTELGKRFALELRNKKLLEGAFWKECPGKITLVSLDSPEFQSKIFPGKTVYLRMHGRTSWYSHNYSLEELQEIVGKILALNPERVFIFFNNNHQMLANARTMLTLWK